MIRIVETAITLEKCELLSYIFAYGYTSRGVTNWCSFFKAMPRHAQSTSKYFKDLRYTDTVLLMGMHPKAQ